MLQFITHQTTQYNTLTSAEIALNGGCKWIQLRMKDASIEEIEAAAIQLKRMCKAHNATFIIDDHVDICLRVDADGVHLGKQDMCPTLARQILGEKKIIGGTANSLEDVLSLVAKGVNYIGLGPFRFTSTKKNLSPILGLEGYKQIRHALQEQNITIPIVAIGGITLEDIPSISQYGYGIALSSTILQAKNPIDRTVKIMELVTKL